MAKRVGRKIWSSLLVLGFCCLLTGAWAEDITCWFPPEWKDAAKAKVVADSLTEKAGVTIRPRIAKSYSEMMEVLSGKALTITYAGSFVQSLLYIRELGIPVLQVVDGSEYNGSWMILPKDGDPQKILQEQPQNIAYAKDTNCGESGAKAATKGAANIATDGHAATANIVKAGKAAAGIVKSGWWKKNAANYPTLKVYQIPEISDEKNPDNVIVISKNVDAPTREKIKKAALDSKDAFGAKEIVPFDPTILNFSLNLMKKSGIDPKTYTWKD